jgi:hypothetical protein
LLLRKNRRINGQKDIKALDNIPIVKQRSVILCEGPKNKVEDEKTPVAC